MEKLSLIFALFLAILSPSCKSGQGRNEISDKVALEAQPFPLSELRLLPGSPFRHAMDKNGEWLMDLSPDRLLHRFRLNAGLEPKGEIYGGWESRGVSGHTLGHYLSACSMMYAASGEECYKERVDYIVKELAECQAARKTGYVGAIPDEDKIWAEVSAGDIRSQGFDLNGGWVPWYTLHKLWAGLIDAYRHTGNEQAKEVAVKLSDWAVSSFGNLSEDDFQKMLACEHGGMNEVFADMYAITGNEDYLKMAYKFCHKAILDPLKEQRDELEGKHSNTQVPKVIGAARLYELTADASMHAIATFYWDRLVNHHSYVNGGNSNYEHLGKPDCLNDRLSPFTSETCNTYNMLKLTRHLFCWDPEAPYMDYYERALYNHILASQNPDDGMVCYSVPLKSGTQKEFSTRFDSFWCCVASGIENHVKYAESVFFRSAKDDGLFVNLFIPTSLNWKEKDLEVKLETGFPADDRISISFKGKKQRFPIHVRYPKWATKGIKVTLNGKEETVSATPGSYFTLEDEWGDDTRLEIEIPMELYTVAMPDNADRMGIFYGPVLLAAPLGNEELQAYDIPCFVSNSGSVTGLITPVAGKPLHFTAQTTANDSLPLIPFYSLHGQKHAVYFDRYTTADWAKAEKEYKDQIRRQKELEARTVDVLRIGEMQPERDHELQSENSRTGDVDGNKYRDAFNGWFSFTAKVDPTQPMRMLCAYWGADKDQRCFDILIDGKKFKTVRLDGTHGPKVFEEEYAIPASFTKGKTAVNVRFQSHADCYAGGLFGFRMLKK